ALLVCLRSQPRQHRRRHEQCERVAVCRLRDGGAVPAPVRQAGRAIRAPRHLWLATGGQAARPQGWRAAGRACNFRGAARGRPGQLLLSEELRGNCAGLTITIKTHIDRLRELRKQAKKEQEGPPPTLFGEWPAAATYARERNRVEALNVVLDSKGCKLTNI